MVLLCSKHLVTPSIVVCWRISKAHIAILSQNDTILNKWKRYVPCSLWSPMQTLTQQSPSDGFGKASPSSVGLGCCLLAEVCRISLAYEVKESRCECQLLAHLLLALLALACSEKQGNTEKRPAECSTFCKEELSPGPGRAAYSRDWPVFFL